MTNTLSSLECTKRIDRIPIFVLLEEVTLLVSVKYKLFKCDSGSSNEPSDEEKDTRERTGYRDGKGVGLGPYDVVRKVTGTDGERLGKRCVDGCP